MKPSRLALVFIILAMVFATISSALAADFLLRQPMNGLQNRLFNVSNITTGNLTVITTPAACTGTNYFMIEWKGNQSTCALATGTGTVSGNGSANRLAYWSNTSTLTNATGLFWNDTMNYLGINTATPGFQLDVNGNGSFGGIIVGYNGLNIASGASNTQALTANGDINTQGGGLIYEAGNRVCTASNGICTGSGGSGAMVLLQTLSITPNSSIQVWNWTNTSYTRVKIMGSLDRIIGPGAVIGSAGMRFNGASGASSYKILCIGGDYSTSLSHYADTSFRFQGNTDNSSRTVHFEYTVDRLATDGSQGIIGNSYASDQIWCAGGRWSGNAAITNITFADFFNTGVNNITGNISIYGISQ